MTYAAWFIFILVSMFFAFLIAYGIKLVLGKYMLFLVPIPTFFLMLFILILMIAAQALGLPVADWYSGFFDYLARLMASGGYMISVVAR